MMPLWLTYVGSTVSHRHYPDATVDIPWFYLRISLILFSVPCIVEVITKSLCPERVAGILVLILRPLATVICFVHLFMAFEENAWIFALLDDWRIIVAAGRRISQLGLCAPPRRVVPQRPSASTRRRHHHDRDGRPKSPPRQLLPRQDDASTDGQISIAVPVLILFITYIPLMAWALVLAVYDVAKRKNRSKFDVLGGNVTPSRSPNGLNDVINAGGDVTPSRSPNSLNDIISTGDDDAVLSAKKDSIYFVDGRGVDSGKESRLCRPSWSPTERRRPLT